MFPKKKLIISILLVAVIVAGMVVPAFASVTGSGTLGSYAYKWEVKCEETRGVAMISSSGTPTDYKAGVRSQLYYDLKNYRTLTEWKYSSGYASVTASVSYIISINDVPVRTKVERTYGSFWVNSTCVAASVLADAG